MATSLYKIGQLFVVGFNGYELNDEITSLIKDYHIGAVILFARNIKNLDQTRTLIRSLQRIAKESGHEQPLLIGIDQENGMVSRLTATRDSYDRPTCTQFPGAMAVGAAFSAYPHDSDVVHRLGLACSNELRAAGFNWNFAPVLDVASEPLNPVIGIRSFHESPHIVGKLGCLFANGLNQNGIIPCAKHFPGHGDTSTDSHLSLPVIKKTEEQLNEVELIPFKRAISENIKSIMVGHIAFPSLTNDLNLPSSLSKDIVTGLLREKLAYDGLVVTDCLEMKAISDGIGVSKAAVMAIQAGVDVVMICHRYDRQVNAINSIKQAIQNGMICESEIDTSLSRIYTIKKQMLNFDYELSNPSYKSIEQNIAIADEIYEKSITVVRDDAKYIPIDISANRSICILSPKLKALNYAMDNVAHNPFDVIEDYIRRKGGNVKQVIYDARSTAMTFQKTIHGADVVIAITADANLHDWQAEMMKDIMTINSDQSIVINLAVGGPYDLMRYKDFAKSYLASYEYTEPSLVAAIRVILGEKKAIAQLPISIPNVCDLGSTLGGWIVESWEPTAESFKSDAIAELWKRCLSAYPISDDKLFKMLTADRELYEPYHFAVRERGQLVGLAVTNKVGFNRPEKRCYMGSLSLVLVEPSYQNRGIGVNLVEAALKYFRMQNNKPVKSIQLGSTLPRFFPGIPQSLKNVQKVKNFFSHRGWKFPHDQILAYDYIANLATIKIPNNIYDKAHAAGIQFASLKEKPELAQEVRRFEWDNFTCHVGWPDVFEKSIRECEGDVIVAYSTNKVIGALLAYGPSNSTFTSFMCDNVAFMITATGGSKVGGIACVGVDLSMRGGGLGKALMYKGIQTLLNRGCDFLYVDWVVIQNFYENIGLTRWEGSAYSTSWMNN